MLDWVFLVLPALVLLATSVWATWVVVRARRSHELSGSLAVQLAIVWAVPVIGALFVASIYRAERRRDRDRERHRKELPWDPIPPSEHLESAKTP